MVGTWEFTDYQSPHDNDYDDVEGILIIYSNDTYDRDMEIEFENGREAKIYDTGTIKACSVNKLIQFFSEKDDDYDMNFRYILNWDTLILEEDQQNVTIYLEKVD